MRVTRFRCVAIVAALLAAATILAGCELPTAFVVDRTTDAVDADPGDGVCATADGDCSLRAAIQEANHQLLPVVVELAPGATYQLTLVGPGEDDGASGDFDTTGRITVEGNGARLESNAGERYVDQRAGSLTIRDLTIENPGFAVGITAMSGIRVATNTVLERVTLRGMTTMAASCPNPCAPSGSAVEQVSGTLGIVDSTIVGSLSYAHDSGAIYQAGGQLVVDRSEVLSFSGTPFSDPTAGIEQQGGEAYISNTRFGDYGTTSNVCFVVGGKYLCAAHHFSASAIRAAGNVTVHGSTASGVANELRVAADIEAVASGSVEVAATRVRWCAGNVTSAGYNRSDDAACVGAAGDGAAADPVVDQIPIGTPRLCDGSILLDHDRLGVVRPQGAACDIGDIESVP